MAERVQQVKGPGARPPRGVKPQVKNPMKIFTRIMKYALKDYTVHCIAVVIAIFVNVLANVQGTMFMKTLIDGYITPMLTQPDPDFGPLLHAILRVAGFYGIGIVAAFIQNRTMIYVSQGTLRNLRNDLFGNMEKLPIKYFDTHAHGDIMSIYTNDIDTLRQMISQSIPQIINSAITIVSVFVSMLILNIPLTITTLVMVSIMLGVTKKVAGFSGNFFVKQQRDLGKVNGFIEEMVEGQKVEKVFNHEPQDFEEFCRRNEALRDAGTKALAYSGMTIPTIVSLSYFNYAVSACVGGLFALAGLTDLGTLASYLVYVRQSAMPMNQFTQQINFLLSALSGAERIFDMMDEIPEIDEGNVRLCQVRENPMGQLKECSEFTGRFAWKVPEETVKRTRLDAPVSDGFAFIPLKGDVRFNDVVFGYVPEKTILNGISLYAKPGQKIAFVGSTGAGKTTIINLVNRFYEVNGGSITYDGIDIREIRKDDLRRSMSMVIQDTHLFTGTIADNIRYGRLDASDEDVRAAAQVANAHSFIRRLPQGYDTVLHSDGANLSQGQRQLLAIARAAISRPPVLILDEATSSIDTRTEKLIEQGMDALMEGRTVFVIAHRLSTVRRSEAIMVLEHGEIMERGDHDELLEQKGRYYQLYTGQFELD